MKKKTFILCLLSLLCNYCYSQNSSKIIFYRNDRWGHLIGGAHIYHDGIIISDSFNRGVNGRFLFSYNTARPSGVYKWGNEKFNTNYSIKMAESSLAFIEIKVKWALFKGSYPVLREISLSRFKKDYRHKKWLRIKLLKAGYKSVEDLIGNLNMHI